MNYKQIIRWPWLYHTQKQCSHTPFHPTTTHFLPSPLFKVRESLNWNRKCNKYSLNSTHFQTPAVYNHYSPLYHHKAERIKQSLEAAVNCHLIARNADFQSLTDSNMKAFQVDLFRIFLKSRRDFLSDFPFTGRH